MSLKEKVKINGEEVDVVIIEAPVKNKEELQKIEGNLEGISEFAEKLGGRYEIRMKLDKTFSKYLTEVNNPLLIPAEKKFNLNLMKVLGFCLVYFYISTFILLFQ
jgi:Holliday junction resolvase